MSIILAASLALLVVAGVMAWRKFDGSIMRMLEGIESLGRHPEGL